MPPYDIFEDILKHLIDRVKGVDAITAAGQHRDLVKRVEHLVYVAECKRCQAAPGVNLGPRIFGCDQRYPMTNGFRDAR